MPDQSRSAAADRQFADRSAAQDPAGQRQSIARAGAGAVRACGSEAVMTPAASGMVSFPPEDRTLPRMLELQAISHGDRTVLSAPGGRWTFRDARDIAAGRGASLRAAGVAAGDRVAILCSNRIEMLEIVLGCGWIGAIAVPINIAAMGPQIAYCLSNSGARLLVIEAQFVERLAHASEGMASLGSIWVIGADYSASGAEPSIEIMPPRAEPIAPAPVSPG